MRKILLLCVAVCATVFSFGQTYLSESFESEFTPNTSAGPNAPSSWSQTRLGTLTSVPGTPGLSGQRDWARQVWSGSAWASNTAPNSAQIPYSTAINGPTGAQSGTGTAWFNDGYAAGTGTSGQNLRRLESPIIDLSASTSPFVSFYQAYTAGSATVALVASNDGGTTWNTLASYSSIGSWAWTQRVVSIPAIYKVANAKIGFLATNTWGSNDIFIDNVIVKEPVSISSTGAGGLWSATTTWAGGVVPVITDNVTIADGTTVTIDGSYSVNSLTVGGGTSGILQYEVTTARTLTVNADVTIAASGTFQSAATGTQTTHLLSLAGNLTNNGTLDFSTNTNTAGASITFTGTGNSNFTGTGTTTDVRTLNLSKSTSAQVVELNLSNFSILGVSSAGVSTTFLTSGTGTGTLKISGSNTFSGTLWSTASYTIPSTMIFWLNNANFTVNGQGGSPTLSGTLRITAGTYNVGTGTGNSISGTSSTTSVIIEGGTFNVAGRLQTTSSGNYNQSAGTVNVCTVGNGTTTSASFAATGSTFTISGGIINLVQASTGTTPYDYQVSATTLSVIGGTLNVGTSATATNFNFRLSGAVPNLVVDNTTNNKTATLFAAVSAYGNVTTNSGATLNLNGFTFTERSTILTNNGTITGTTTSSRLSFFSPTNAAQIFAGSGVVTSPLDGLSVQTTGGLTISHTNGFNTLRVNLFAGTITNSNKLTLGTGAALAVTVQVGAAASTTPGGSFDATPTFNLGTGTYSIGYQQETTARTTGFELPVSRSITNLTINNTNGLTINGGTLTITGSAGLTLTAGNITTTNANRLILASTVTTIPAGSATSYVSGPLEIQTAATAVNISRTFPIGINGAFRPISINTFTNNNSAQNYIAEAITGATGGTGSGINLNTTRYFKVSNTANMGTTTSIAVTLTYGVDDNVGTQASARVGQANTAAGTYSPLALGTNTASTVVSATSAGFTAGNDFFVIGNTAALPPSWVGGATGNWGENANWSTGAVPTATDNALIAGNVTVTVAGTVTPYQCLGLTLGSGATLVNAANTLSVIGAASTGITIYSGATLTLNGGTINVGPQDNTTNDRIFSNAGGILNVTSGTLNIAGVLNVSSGTFTQSGGDINVDFNGTVSSAATSAISLTGSSTYNLSGGTITIVDPGASGIVAFTYSATANTICTGTHTVRFGDGVSTTPGLSSSVGFGLLNVSTTPRFHFRNLTINGTNLGANRFVTQSDNSVLGDFTITTGSEYRQSSNSLHIAGNMIINGTLVSDASADFLAFEDFSSGVISPVTVAQTVSGTGSIQNLTTSPTAEMAILRVNNTGAGNVTMNMANPLRVTGGITITNGKFTTTGLTLNGIGAQTVALTAATSSINVTNFTSTNTSGSTLSGSGFLNVTGTVNVTASALASNGRLTLKSTSTTNARVGTVAAGAITGNVTVERYIPAGNRAFRLLTPSVTTTNFIKDNWQEGSNNTSLLYSNNQNPNAGYGTHITGSATGSSGFDATSTGNPSLYQFSNAGQTWGFIANTNATNLLAGNAYRLLVRGNRAFDLSTTSTTNTATTLRATGTLLTGDIVFGYVGNGTNTAGMPTLNNTVGGLTVGFSLVGNPYVSPVNWDNVYLDASGLEDYYYTWDPTRSLRGAYVFWDKSDGFYTGPAGSAINQHIQPGQAIFVKATTTTPVLTFKESRKSSTFTNVFRTQTTLTGKLSIGLTNTALLANNNGFDGANILFADNFSAAIDGEDAPKITNQDENLSVFSGSTNLMKESRPTVTANDTVQLRVWQLASNSYILTFDAQQFAGNKEAYLLDGYLNSVSPISITGNTQYPFTTNAAAASFVDTRFKIVFKTSGALPVTVTNVKAFQKNTGVQVEWNTVNETNMAAYEVEKSIDATSFTKAGTVTATGNSSYNWYDVSPVNGNNYYRIKMVDKNGTFKYTQVVNVKIGGIKNTFTIVGNPIRNKTITLQMENVEKGSYTVNVFNNLGQTIATKTINHNGGSATETIALGNAAAAGTYQLSIIGNNVKENRTIIVE